MSYHLPRNGRRAVSYLRAKGLPLIGVVAVLTVAASLRLYGLGWDDSLPYTPHPDERAILMEVAELSPPSLGNPRSVSLHHPTRNTSAGAGLSPERQRGFLYHNPLHVNPSDCEGVGAVDCV